MNLVSPWSLLWALPLMGVVVALYLMRMRRRDQVVPASFLWPPRTDEVRANAPFQRLRFSWLLLLQLLALALLVLALAGPQLRQRGLAGSVTVIVLDSSASMGATDVQPSRFDAAVSAVRGMVGSARPGERLALILAGSVPRVVFPLSDDPARQRKALESVGASDAEADIGESLRLAAALVGSTSGARILVLSDGSFPEVRDFSPGQATVTYRRFGTSRTNASVSALGVAETTDGRAAYVAVHNHDSQPVQAALDLTSDGKPVDSFELTVGPNETKGRTVSLPAGAKTVTASLRSGGGILAADDRVVALTEAGSRLRVLLVGQGDFFLERALALDPRVTLDRAAALPETERASAAGATVYDVVVFEGVAEQPVKAAGVLTLGAAGSSSPVQRTGKTGPQRFVDAEDTALMRGVDFDEVYIDSGEKVKPVGRGRVLAESDQGPLVVAAEGKQRQVYLAFRPLDSDFPLSVGFPIFIANALTFLAGAEGGSDLLVKPGQSFAVGSRGQTTATVTGPDGFQATVAAKDGRFLIPGLARVGEYVLTVGQRKTTVHAVLRSDEESDVTPRDAIDLPAGQVAATQTSERLADVWKWVVLLGLLVLGVEWWVFARRS